MTANPDAGPSGSLAEAYRVYADGHEELIRGLELADVSASAFKDIVEAAGIFATSKATLSLYCQGLNQSSHGTHNNAALINLHLAQVVGKVQRSVILRRGDLEICELNP